MITLMKRLTFEEVERANVVLSDLDARGWPTKIRLDPQSHSIKLVRAGLYPTTSNHYAMTPLTRPAAVRRWVGLQVDAICPLGPGRAVSACSIGLRLNDGVDDWYWSGSAWVKGTAVWNTEAEVASHIATFNALTTRQFRVVVNLRTTDGNLTPECFGVRVAYEADIPSQQEDLLYRTLIPTLRAQLRPTTEFVADSDGSTSFDLGMTMTGAEAQHHVVGVEAVFDHTGDPSHLVNLYSSFNSTTKIVTLLTPVTTGNVVLVRAIYEPAVVFETTDQDYVEVEEIPAVILRNLNASRSHVAGQPDEVVDKHALTALVFPEMMQMQYDCNISVITPSGVDQQRLQEQLSNFFSENCVMRTTGTDEPFELLLRSEFVSATNPSPGEAHVAEAAFSIENAYFQVRRVQTSEQDAVYPVGALVFVGDVSGQTSVPGATRVIIPASVLSAVVFGTPQI